MVVSDLPHYVAAVRSFNRFYTKQIGVLHESLLHSPFSLTEARVVYELANREETTATELSAYLSLDAGYLSRIVRGLAKRGFLEKQPSASDGRQNLLRLTEQGQEAFAFINTRSHNEVEAMLDRLAPTDQARLVEAMRTIESLLGAQPEPRVPYLLRPHQPGDMGWVIHRHGVLYSEEYGWDETFESLVASICAKFIDHFDPARERCWIAERDGENVGSVFVVKHTESVAKLRLLLVEPKARGLGIGSRLVDECVRFARRSGYTQMLLWTNSCLTAARHIYARAGFTMIESGPHHSFGHHLVGETWSLDL